MVQYYWETMEACVLPMRVLEAMRSSGLREVKCSTRFEVLSEYTAVKA
jgi:demethylmenaquinone methyltransferase/2-methoxy-6-polyprenyl-1,4-benzoquinol methylase